MADVVRDVIDTILGESTYRGTKEDRYRDMVAIASVIENRSRALGVSHLDVVSVQSEFNAFGKSLPPGAEKFRDMAQKAWKEVQENGPVHNATFYATEAAKGRLPSGLKQVTSTNKGHVFFEDPQARSIKTSKGFMKPSNPALPAAPPVPATKPEQAGLLMGAAGVNSLLGQAANDRVKPGGGLANLTGGRLSFANSNQTGISPALRDTLTRTGQALGTNLSITSGHRTPERNRAVGGARNSYHVPGLAADIDMTGMSNAQRSALVAELARQGAGGFITYSKSPNMLHVDMRKGAQPHFMFDRSARHMARAPGWFQEAAQGKYSRATPASAALGLLSPENTPVPVSREQGVRARYEKPASSWPIQDVFDAYQKSKATVDPVAAYQEYGKSRLAAAPVDPMAAYQEYGKSRLAAPPAMPAPVDVPSQPVYSPVPDEQAAAYRQNAATRAAAPAVPGYAAPAVQQAYQQYAQTRQQAQQQAPSVHGVGMQALEAVRAGAAPMGFVAQSVNDPSVTATPTSYGGYSVHNSKHGYTSYYSKDGTFMGQKFDDGQNKGILGSLFGSPESQKGPSMLDKAGAVNAARGIAGRMAGAALGGYVGGPVGGLLGGFLGQRAAEPGGLLGRAAEAYARATWDGKTSAYGSGFPSAPSAPTAAELASIGATGAPSTSLSDVSARARDAIDRGYGGLF